MKDTIPLNQRSERLQIHQLVRALKGVKRGECWCEMAVGNPMVHKHAPQCLNAQAVIKKVEGRNNGE